MSKNPAISIYKRFPKELFRINNGWRVNLRARTPGSDLTGHDIVIAEEQLGDDGVVRQDAPKGGKRLVLPRALDLEFAGPNGATFRPNTPYLQHLVSHEFRGKDAVVFGIQAGTEVPSDLVLVHQGQDSEEWSLQPSKEMTLEDLNNSITNFLVSKAAMMTRKQWAQAYPAPKDPASPHYPLPKNWRPRAQPFWKMKRA